MTEDQARLLWCHASRVVMQDVESEEASPPANRIQMQNNGKTVGSGPVKTATCVASSCMAWRWRRDVGAEVGKHGYCGLAGRPE